MYERRLQSSKLNEETVMKKWMNVRQIGNLGLSLKTNQLWYYYNKTRHIKKYIYGKIRSIKQ